MKILAYAPTYVPTYCAGDTTMLHDILKFMVSKGHEVTVMVNKPIEPYEIDGIPVIPRQSTAFKRFDLIICQLDVTTETIRLADGKPIIWIMHNTFPYPSVTQNPHVAVVYNAEWAIKATNYPDNPYYVLPPPVDREYFGNLEKLTNDDFSTTMQVREPGSIMGPKELQRVSQLENENPPEPNIGTPIARGYLQGKLQTAIQKVFELGENPEGTMRDMPEPEIGNAPRRLHQTGGSEMALSPAPQEFPQSGTMGESVNPGKQSEDSFESSAASNIRASALSLYDSERGTNHLNGYITLINCNENKGGKIFHEIAKSMPERQFLAVLGAYGQQYVSLPDDGLRPVNLDNRAQITGLGHLPNVTVIENTPDMLHVYAQTRILLMPSLYESWGRVATEAMCSGIPVICTPTEGLKENCGESGIFIEDRENINQWVMAIKKLDGKREYGEASARSKKRSYDHNSKEKLEGFEQFAKKVVTGHAPKKEHGKP